MVTQSEDELRAHLQEQVRFLKTSAEMFDKGNLAEAKRLAVAVRVLLHDTERSLSLLGQLSLKDRSFFDTASPRPRTIITSYAGLVGTSFMGGPSEYVPHLGSAAGTPIPFTQWWEAPIIIDTQQREISRRKLVLAVSNKDGGAHVDPELDKIYAGVSRANAMGRMRNDGSGWKAMPGLALASVRQIAYEVLVTLGSKKRGQVLQSNISRHGGKKRCQEPFSRRVAGRLF
jgi:hypothetical protein